MPTITAFYGNYDNSDVVDRLINYCFISKYAESLFKGGSAVLMGKTVKIIEQFKLLQNAYNKTEGKLVQHFIISFNDNSCNRITLLNYDAYCIAYMISRYIGTRFQNVFAVHQGSEDKTDCLYNMYHGPDVNPDNLHVHFVVNRVSYIDGKMFYGNKNDYYNIFEFAKQNLHVSLDNSLLSTLKWYGVYYQESSLDR